MVEQEYSGLLQAMAMATALLVLTVVIHYEVLRLTSKIGDRVEMRPRTHILLGMFGAFVAHIIEIWVYAGAYFLMVEHLDLGHFGGHFEDNWLNYLYYSTTSYTSLGLGDVYPTGEVRLITGVEALNGLVLIAWSASFTYLSMEKYWKAAEES